MGSGLWQMVKNTCRSWNKIAVEYHFIFPLSPIWKQMHIILYFSSTQVCKLHINTSHIKFFLRATQFLSHQIFSKKRHFTLLWMWGCPEGASEQTWKKEFGKTVSSTGNSTDYAIPSAPRTRIRPSSPLIPSDWAVDRQAPNRLVLWC